jgi:hypothetical protein
MGSGQWRRFPNRQDIESERRVCSQQPQNRKAVLLRTNSTRFFTRWGKGALFFRDLDGTCLGRRFRHGYRLNYGRLRSALSLVGGNDWHAEQS